MHLKQKIGKKNKTVRSDLVSICSSMLNIMSPFQLNANSLVWHNWYFAQREHFKIGLLIEFWNFIIWFSLPWQRKSRIFVSDKCLARVFLWLENGMIIVLPRWTNLALFESPLLFWLKSKLQPETLHWPCLVNGSLQRGNDGSAQSINKAVFMFIGWGIRNWKQHHFWKHFLIKYSFISSLTFIIARGQSSGVVC